MRIRVLEIRRTMVGVIALLLFLGSTSRAQQPVTGDAKTPDRPNGTMTGRVMNSAGEPLAGAIAYVMPVGGLGSSQNAPVDSNGNFRVDGLETRIYRVSASMPGYIPAPQLPMAEPSYYHPGDSVTVTMIKGAVISGTVTGPNGAVVATSVRALRVRDDEGKALSSANLVRERLTDDRGVYRIYGLPPGAYLIVAGGPPRFGLGGIAPGVTDGDAPTYFPSATRDTASEIIVRNGEEATADIQYRGEPGHSISGNVTGIVQPQTQMPVASTIFLIDVRDRSVFMSGPATPFSNYTFAFYGIPDGDYELYASQSLPPSRDFLRSSARRATVRGGDVTGLNLVLASLSSIEGQLVLENDPKAGCAKRRETAARETIILARRYEPETKPAGNATSKIAPLPEAPLLLTNSVSESVVDAKQTFTMRNLGSGLYRIDPRAPASGWYVRSITIGSAQTARNSSVTVARDGITLRPGEHLSGLTVTITEGAARLRGRVTVAEGQHVSAGLRVYLVPAERESSENVLRFFEAAVNGEAGFAIDNIAPGRYWLIARLADDGDPAKVKPIRQESTLRVRVLREAEALKKEVSFKPCEQSTDYELPWMSPAKQ
ncbi:MAG TPA: carboxypeptidase-like regulatory domain-containing protein [Pyrinomonadaceae bacterium]|nr:carboxypeptidase-like regulatory domain-containing protein [Pyrinomonadaceae bacterium]